jgi:molybdopterin synthase catalytic subunit
MFSITDKQINQDQLKDRLLHQESGARIVFEGIVRNHHQGKQVVSLTYEAHPPLVQIEGDKILVEANKLYDIKFCFAVHRIGQLHIGDCAVWIGVSAPHRDPAFQASRYVIEELKLRLPIWKKEFYPDGNYDWVNCQTKVN